MLAADITIQPLFIELEVHIACEIYGRFSVLSVHD